MRRIVPGSVDDSYGIEVSKLAGIPDWIIKRAHEILSDLESGNPVAAKVSAKANTEEEGQLSLGADSAVETALKKLDLNTLTPLEALNKLYEFKAML